MKNSLQLGALLAIGALLPDVVRAAAAESAEMQALRDQMQALQKQIDSLSQRIATEREAAPSPAKIALTDRGYTFASADGANSIRFRGTAQFDSRQFVDDGGGIANDLFLLRRARIITSGTFARNSSYVFIPEFGGGTVTLMDATIGVNLGKSLQIQAGKFTPPLGLERLQGVCWNFFSEAGLTANLVPVRDVGAQLAGVAAGGTVNFQVGVFSGAPDAATASNTDCDSDKDIDARVMLSPFKNVSDSPLQGLTFGVAGNSGRSKTAAGRTAGYKSDGQQTIFSYTAATVADGRTWRVVPQLDYRLGSFGIMGEYVVSAVTVRSGAEPTTELRNSAWQCAMGYVLTGEPSAYSGVVPRTNLDLDAGTWGAVELIARVGGLRVDDDAFPVYASPGYVKKTTSYAVGLNWYLSKTIMFRNEACLSQFDFPANSPAARAAAYLRKDEKVLITRLQLAF